MLTTLVCSKTELHISFSQPLAGPQSPGRILSEEQFSCSICLEVFVEPVSTPCGHTFCKACLQGYWNHSKKFLCPMCKKTFSRQPELSVNCVLAEIAEQFQGLSTMSSVDRANVEFANSPQKDDDWGDFAKAGDVPCSACIGRKMKAMKSCLSCPGSFCEAHLRHHKKGKAMSSHKLVEPIHNLEDKMCKTHKRLLDAYCRNEHVCVCKECADSSHKGHDVVSTEREWKKKTVSFNTCITFKMGKNCMVMNVIGLNTTLQKSNYEKQQKY